MYTKWLFLHDGLLYRIIVSSYGYRIDLEICHLTPH